MIPRYDWWYDFEERTFEKWAVNAGLIHRPKPIEKSWGGICYASEDVFTSFEITDKLKRKAKKNRPLTYFRLITVPYLIEKVIHFPHQVCHDIHYFFYNLRERFDIINLRTSWSYKDPDWRLERAVEIILIEYVEEECGGLNGKYHGLIGQSQCKEYSADRRKDNRELIEAYKFFKVEGPKIQKKIDSLYKNNCKDTKIRRAKLQSLDKEYSTKREKHLNNIWKNRKYLWT